MLICLPSVRAAAAGRATIQPGMTSVDLPVRGFITTDDDGRQSVNFVRTGVGDVSPSVPVFRPVRDELTGLDKITLPAVAGAPARTILINPVPTGPAAPAHTGNGSPGPKSPVHTGTGIRQADSIVVTTFPADVVQDLQDFILWQPDATEIGVEAIYVMVSKPYGETNAGANTAVVNTTPIKLEAPFRIWIGRGQHRPCRRG